jgi:hypothetical protein
MMQSLALDVPRPLSWPRFKTWHLFLMLVAGTMINVWFQQTFLLSQETYHLLLEGQLEAARIDEYYFMMKKVSIWNYALAPILILVKILFLALLIQTPLVFKFIDIPFKTLFRVMTQASFVMLAAGVVATLWLMQYAGEGLTQEQLSFVPLSLTNLVEFRHYPLQLYSLMASINLFELLWGWVIVRGLVATKKLQTLDATLVVLSIWTALLVIQWIIITYAEKLNT